MLRWIKAFAQKGWWIRLRCDKDHQQPHFERYVLPTIAVTPWHKSALASVPGLQEGGSFSLALLFWIWRIRLVVGQTTRLVNKKEDQHG